MGMREGHGTAMDTAGRERRRVFLFSGHGGHVFHMARPIYEAHGRFRAWMDRIDALMTERLGASVVRRLYDPAAQPSDPLRDFSISHPAIFMVECALAHALIERAGPPDLVLGASVGELAAATVAGAVSLEQAVDIVAQHVEVFGRPGGGMSVVLASPETRACAPEMLCGCEVVSTFPGSHFVVAGETAELDALETMLGRQRLDSVRLPVGQAFHSSRIDRFRTQLLAGPPRAYTPLAVPMISCATVAAVPAFSDDHLWSAIRRPLRVADALDLAAVGPVDLIDLGPGSTFASLLRRRHGGHPDRRIFPLLTPFGGELAALSRIEVAIGEEALGPSAAA
jgi:acyl transferase domain-containing protein